MIEDRERRLLPAEQNLCAGLKIRILKNIIANDIIMIMYIVFINK
jgi:hypothetical protein